MSNPQKDSEKNARKFLFDLHNFDDPEPQDEQEDLPPPPPTFSQDELEAARTLAFEQGRQKGLNEALASREQQIALILQQVSTQFATLFAGEQEREANYEQEAILLTLRALEKLFPALNERFGGHEALQAIQRVLRSAADQSDITIRIHPDYTGDVEALLAPLRDKEINPPSFHIAPDPRLGAGDCQLQWSDGGAVRDADMLAGGVFAALTALLPQEMAEKTGAEGTLAENDDINEEDRAESPPAHDGGDRTTFGEADE